jgi:hypothetical protein
LKAFFTAQVERENQLPFVGHAIFLEQSEPVSSGASVLEQTSFPSALKKMELHAPQ